VPARPRLSDQEIIRCGLAIVASLAAATLLSFVRIAATGTWQVDDGGLLVVLEMLVVLALMVAGWFYLRASWACRQQPLRPLLVVAIALQLTAALAPPLTSNDLFSNIAYGRLVLNGLNPYVATSRALDTHEAIVSLVNSPWRDTYTPYGPIATYLHALAAFPSQTWAAVALYKLLIVTCVIGCLALAYGFCRHQVAPARQARAFLFFAWNPLLAWELSAQAHNDVLIVVAATGFVWAASSRHQWLALLALLVGFYAKFALAPILGLYLVLIGRRSMLRAAAMFLVSVGAGAALFAPFWDGYDSLRGPLVAAVASPDRLANSLVMLVCGGAGLFSAGLREAAFESWIVVSRGVCLCLALRAIARATTLCRLLHDGLVFLLVYECLAMGWFLAWYATWLLPLALAVPRMRRIVAVFTVIVPVLYLPYDAWFLAPLAVLGLPLVWLWQSRRLLENDDETEGDSRPLPAWLRGPYLSYLAAHPERLPSTVARYARLHCSPLLSPRRAARPTRNVVPRLIVSLTTIPSRIHRIKPVLNSLIDQDYPADAIWLVLPRYSRREQVEYAIPEFLQSTRAITIVRCETDWGPATKLIPALQREEQPDTLILAVDDDNIYPRDFVSTFLAWHRRHPDAALGYRGWPLPPSLDWNDTSPLYATSLCSTRAVDVVTGTWGLLVQPRFFDQALTDYGNSPSEAFFVDDIWFNGHLARRGVPRIVIPAANPPWPSSSSWVNGLCFTENGDGRKNNVVIRSFAKHWLRC
jgi:hypothetical protein